MSGKKFNDALKTFDRDYLYPPKDAVAHAKNTATAKFDESIDIVVRLGVDPRKADQMVRGTVALPAGTGKDVRIAVFAAGEAADAAREAGADFVGADDRNVDGTLAGLEQRHAPAPARDQHGPAPQ